MFTKRLCPPGITVALFLLLMPAMEPVFAQMPGLSAGGGSMNAAMIALFGSNTAFSARAEFRILNRDQKETENMPLNYAFANGKTRTEIDLSQFKSTETAPQFLTTFKQLGMDHIIVIARPDKKLTWSVYPRAKSYLDVPMTKEEISAQAANYRFDKTPEGRETVEGHDCEKIKITLTDAKGDKTAATVWTAADLRSFPIQMRMAIDVNNTMIITFRDVKLTPPDSREFEVPGALTKYESPEAMLDTLSKRPAATLQ
jgi:hypothetical protein